jgi:hypothetical protein
MLVSGAIIGQDTLNGNRSKEEASISILDRLVEADRRMIENCMNAIVIPALYGNGWLPVTDATFRFSAAEDTDRLWTYTRELLPHKDIDNEWLTEKFGIPVRDKTYSAPMPAGKEQSLSLQHFMHTITAGDPDFFA